MPTQILGHSPHGEQEVRGHARVETRFRSRAGVRPTTSCSVVSDTGSARRDCRRETGGCSALTAAAPPSTATLELACLERFEFWLAPGCPLPRCQPPARMLGAPVSYERIPYFFSDQNRIGLDHSGYATEWEEVVFRGEREVERSLRSG
jgi:hypothetical protein